MNLTTVNLLKKISIIYLVKKKKRENYAKIYNAKYNE